MDNALQTLRAQILDAVANRTPLDLRGHGSKVAWRPAPARADAQVLDVTPLAGISAYEPTELVVTVRAGTSLAELEAVLAEQGQFLAFEPPRLGGRGTVGGMVASGLAGPSRASVGSVRDFVLGATMLNGRGELLSFGGQVMKNVAGYDLDAAAILLCESDGTPEEVEEEIGRMTEVLRRCGASRLEVSRDEAQRLKFWSGRKNAFPASGRISPDYLCMDSTIPRKRLADMLRAIAEMELRHDLRCCNVFHAGDGNLHPLILFDASRPGQLERAEAFGAEILETSVAMGGTITGEHGVGVEKLNSMCVQFAPEEREMMLAVKRAFDAPGLLNPGKVIPTLHRCAEYGRMHVKRGLLPFSELPRF